MSEQKWTVDHDHTEIGFKVRHMMITNVSGTFDRYRAGMTSVNPDFSDSTVWFEADTDSVNTRNPQRDEHLRSVDFFKSADHPKMSFKSTSFTKTGDKTFSVSGDLTIREVSRPFTFTVEHTGQHKDPWGRLKAGFEMSGVLNRTDYGLVWQLGTEDGTTVVDEQVKILVNIQMIME